MSIQFKDLTKMIVFAKNEKGEIKLIDDVANGYECECFCLNCGGKLNAKNNGKIKSHHFAHANGSDCKKGHENTELNPILFTRKRKGLLAYNIR